MNWLDNTAVAVLATSSPPPWMVGLALIIYATAPWASVFTGDRQDRRKRKRKK